MKRCVDSGLWIPDSKSKELIDGGVPADDTKETSAANPE